MATLIEDTKEKLNVSRTRVQVGLKEIKYRLNTKGGEQTQPDQYRSFRARPMKT
jgi:hypothetical protein